MKLVRIYNLILIVIFLSACGRGTDAPTASLPTAPVSVTHAPDAQAVLSAYLDALLVEDYASMYARITQADRATLSLDDFSKRYTDALNTMSVETIDYNILSTLTNPGNSQVAFRIVYHTVLFGDIQRDFNVNLALEENDWALRWDEGLILPELSGGKRLVANHISPARGNIYDRSGNAVVTQSDAYALGLTAGAVAEESEGTVISRLSQLTGVRPDIIRNDYQNYPEGLYVPVGEASASAVDRSGIAGFSGVERYFYNSRFYEPGAASHAAGYTLYITPEQVNAYRRLGYSGAERIGATGVENWGEEILHGRNAATLYVATADGTAETVLAQVDSQPASSIYMTIDSDLQAQAQAAMDGLPGAIVVMEVDTGRVLAMVSSPGFDPNLFNSANTNSMNLTNMLEDPDLPTFNRAAKGQYPLGSVFKIITMAAALESGDFTVDSTLDCQYEYTEMVPSGPTLYDWTWAHCEDEKLATGNDTCSNSPSNLPSGVLTLPEGLMRSCDPWFYHIGYTLFNDNKANAISDMARGFGLGQTTGILQVGEEAGVIPVPADGLQATSLAIGQGNTQVTPLQVADFIAAVANGGTLYRPQLVEKIQPVSGDMIQVFKPEARGTLPVSQENLKAIQAAMRSVAENPRGTAYSRLGTFSIPTAGKTGTAESGYAVPQAWFAGYSLYKNPDKPDIAVAVIVERQGEGAVWALPIFRRVMEIYFFGRPQTIYPWESSFGTVNPEYGLPVTPTPEP